jgi:DNA polymerase I-like protein with 3'-5' exonuclease and polymerase domains
MFPGVKEWQQRVYAEYERTGYATGHSGFRRRAPIERNQIINSPIQSDEAIIVFDAMTRLSKLGIQAAIEVHDDLTFILHKNEVDKKAEIIIREMINCPFKWAQVVPLTVEMSIGKNWAEMDPVGTFSSDTFAGLKQER